MPNPIKAKYGNLSPYRDDLELEICQLDRFNQTSSAILTGFDPHPTLTVGFYLNPQLQDLEIVLRIATITKLTSSLAFSFQLFTRFAVVFADEVCGFSFLVLDDHT